MLEDREIGKSRTGRVGYLSLDAIGISSRGLLDTHIALPARSRRVRYALEEIARNYTGRELKAVDGIERNAMATRARSISWREPVETKPRTPLSGRWPS